jgi:voltage-gated sodium channel
MSLARSNSISRKLERSSSMSLARSNSMSRTLGALTGAGGGGRQEREAHQIAQTSAEEGAIISKEVLYEIPPPEERVFDGKWEKKAVTSKGVIWQPKYAVLTASTLGFAKVIDGDAKGTSHWMHNKKLRVKEWELESIFHQFDVNGNGTLEIMECKACLEHLNLYSNSDDIQRLFHSLDADNSASLDLDEFKQLAKWAHISNFVLDYIPLQEITVLEYDIVEVGRRRSVVGVEFEVKKEFEEHKSVWKQIVGAVEDIVGVDIDEDGEVGADKLPDWNENTHEFHLRIMTADEGHNSAKTYVHRIPKDQAQLWWDALRKTIRERKVYVARKQLEDKYGHSRWSLARALMHKMYQSDAFQYLTALAILLAFTLDICESQMLPTEGTYAANVFLALDATMTAVFTAELLINIFAHSYDGFRPFYSRGWNWFDTFIVVVSLCNVILSYSGTELPNAKLLRLLRLGRVVRLFALKDLQRIITAVSFAVFPVCNAFLILLIVASLYAILATSFFNDRSPEYFANFSTSLFTMFQILSGDSWASGISRSLFSVDGGGTGSTDPNVALFFVSYLLINSMMLLNVVVAVLLDEFISCVEQAKEEVRRLEALEIEKRKVKGCLDPLTNELITFVDDEDLQERIDVIWTTLDFDNDGKLGFEEFQVIVMMLVSVSVPSCL